MSKRNVKIIDEINYENYKLFCEEMDVLEQESANKAINIDLTSEGGTVYASVAFFDRIRRSPCEVRITASGICGSAAILVLASGDLRFATPSTWFMVHEEEEAGLEGPVSKLETVIKHSRELEDQCATLLEEATGRSLHFWNSVSKETAYFGVDLAKEWGLIDGIIENKKVRGKKCP